MALDDRRREILAYAVLLGESPLLDLLEEHDPIVSETIDAKNDVVVSRDVRLACALVARRARAALSGAASVELVALRNKLIGARVRLDNRDVEAHAAALHVLTAAVDLVDIREHDSYWFQVSIGAVQRMLFRAFAILVPGQSPAATLDATLADARARI